MSKEGRLPIRPWKGGLAAFAKAAAAEETAAPWLQIAPLLQPGDCFAHHPITEVSLLDPQ
jgi:hypothetical protein